MDDGVLTALVLVESLERIKLAWEDAHRDSVREMSLGHAAAGMFFFYWVSPDMLRISELVRCGRAEDIRDAAADYIDSRFGEDRGPTLALAAA